MTLRYLIRLLNDKGATELIPSNLEARRKLSLNLGTYNENTQKQSKAKQRCVMGVGMCLYAQLVQTKIT